VKEQLTSECQRVQEIRDEKKKHAASYHRYVALQKELLQRAETIDELAGILGPDDAYKAMLAACNSLLGNSHDNVEILQAAIKYLRKSYANLL